MLPLFASSSLPVVEEVLRGPEFHVAGGEAVLTAMARSQDLEEFIRTGRLLQSKAEDLETVLNSVD